MDNLQKIVSAEMQSTCPLGDRHGIDLLNGIHTQLGMMSTQLTHVMETSEEALTSIRASDGRINDLAFDIHSLKTELTALKESHKLVRVELDSYRKGVMATAVTCLLGLVGLIGNALKDHFTIGWK